MKDIKNKASEAADLSSKKVNKAQELKHKQDKADIENLGEDASEE